MSDPNLNIRLPAELKARVAAQAESLGRSLSDHSRAIIAEHFDGPDLGALREQLGDLAEQVTRLVETSQAGRGGGGAERGALIDLATEVAEMKAMNRELAATVHNALRIIVYQQLLPTEEQYQQLRAQFEALKEAYQGRSDPGV